MSKPGTICHLEIRVTDMAQARDFYGTVFGWSFQDLGTTYMLALVEGVSIGIELVDAPPSDGPHLPYVEVAGIKETLTNVEAAGGKVEEGATEIAGGLGWFAIFRDPSGNRLGIHRSHS